MNRYQVNCKKTIDEMLTKSLLKEDNNNDNNEIS